jgi:Fe-S oxidoreductase
MMSTKTFTDTIKACRVCLLCRHACTVGNVTLMDTNLPRGKALLLYATQVELLDWDHRVVEVMYQCTSCHLCREWCVNGWDIAPLTLAARAEIAGQGLEPEPARRMKETLLASGNRYGESAAPLRDWIASLGLPDRAPLLYFAGPTAAYRQPELVRSAVALLQRCGADFTLLPAEPDPGDLLFVLGYRPEARQFAGRTLEALRDSGATTIVSSDPTAIETFRHGYRDWGLEIPEGLRFLHMSEYLAGEIASGRLVPQLPLELSVTYHDPCSLGREMKVFDAPRQVLSALPGLELREMRLNREHALCCGNGGGVPVTNFPIAEAAGQNAGKVILETGAQVLVTACPSCKSSFAQHTPGMQVLDLAELVLQALGD